LEIRENGDATAKKAAQWEKHMGVNPKEAGKVRFYLESENIVDNSDAYAFLGFADNWIVTGTQDYLPAGAGFNIQLQGDGTITLRTRNSAGSSGVTIGSETNTYINNIEWVELEWDGNKVTGRAYDGNSVVETSAFANYPAQLLHLLVIKGLDRSTSAALNVDFDVVSIEWK